MRQARQILLASALLGLLWPRGLTASSEGCRVEQISTHRLVLPVPGSATVGPVHLAVDERGTIYVAFSSLERRGHERFARLHLVSYDANGRLLHAFERPALLPEEAKWAQITSLAYAGGRVYASAQWWDERWRGALFLFSTSGDLQRSVSLEGLANPRVLAHSSEIHVFGTLAESGDQPVIWTFSAEGERLSTRSFSASLEPTDSLLADASGRFMLLKADGEVRTLAPERMLMKIPDGFGHIQTAFPVEGAIVVNRVDRESRRMSLIFLSERGERCEVETTGRLSPLVRGADGLFYGFGQLAITPKAPPEHRELLLGKFRITWRRNGL